MGKESQGLKVAAPALNGVRDLSLLSHSLPSDNKKRAEIISARLARLEGFGRIAGPHPPRRGGQLMLIPTGAATRRRWRAVRGATGVCGAALVTAQ